MLGVVTSMLTVAQALPQGAAIAASDTASHARQQTAADLLRQNLRDGEAIVWYLGHAGWAVKTRTQLLIFDYWQMQQPPSDPSLANGYVNADELSDQRVTVLVTHSHGDHFDPVIFEWERATANIKYVFGWMASHDPNHVCLTDERALLNIDGIEITTINHSFDNIPEVAFLVRVDGLVIYHSGDHGSVGDELDPVFRDNIDYLANRVEGTDIAFLSVFGRRGGGIVNRGDLYTVEQLQPAVVFPMHRGRDPNSYEEWARAMVDSGIPYTVRHATSRGEWFYYRDGNATQGELGRGNWER
jgi:L-ascorbate metabolism protein UlaG (beta-lactamase superfamily)